MLSRRLCLVHGDFSPKNVLVAPKPDAGTWVIDFEVTHLGDPAFDIAFLLTHLTLKSIHRPELAAAYDQCVLRFAASYQREMDTRLIPTWSNVLQHAGCLLLARVKGKSTAGYLTEAQRDQTWRLGMDILAAPPELLAGLATRRGEALQ